jgi:two-component system, OmpR family, copper resistance phosphate regulon response regulator CusR
MNILLVEDDEKTARFIKSCLEENFHHAIIAYDGPTAQLLAVRNDFELIIADALLKEWNAFDICRQIRYHKNDLPILLLTTPGTLKYNTEGFESGIDDYLAKPFHFQEMLAKIDTLKNRLNAGMPESVYDIGNLHVDLNKKLVTRGDKPIALTLKEFALLRALLYNKNRVLSRNDIAEAVWGLCSAHKTSIINSHINHLRDKIDKGAIDPLIHTVIGEGYIIRN